MRERLTCLMQKVIRKMIGKKEPPTLIEASENKKPVCLRKNSNKLLHNFCIFKKSILIIYLSLPVFYFVTKITLFQWDVFV